MNKLELLDYIYNLEKVNINSCNKILKNVNIISEKKIIRNRWNPFVEMLLKEVDRNILSNVLEKIEAIYFKFHDNKKTLDASFSTHVRKIIVEKYGYKSKEHLLSKEKCRISYEDKETIINEKNDKVNDRNENKLKINYDEMIDIINDCVISPNPYKNYIAILLVSGIRKNEVFKSKFEIVNDKLIQSEISKDHLNRKIEKELLVIEKHEFINLLNKTKTKISKEFPKLFVDGELISTIGDRLSNQLNEIITCCSVEIIPNYHGITIHKLRAIYANMLYIKSTEFSENEENKLKFINKALGHLPPTEKYNECEGSLHYSDIMFVKEKQFNYTKETIIEIETDSELDSELDEPTLSAQSKTDSELNDWKDLTGRQHDYTYRICAKYKNDDKKVYNELKYQKGFSKISKNCVKKICKKFSKFKKDINTVDENGLIPMNYESNADRIIFQLECGANTDYLLCSFYGMIDNLKESRYDITIFIEYMIKINKVHLFMHSCEFTKFIFLITKQDVLLDLINNYNYLNLTTYYGDHDHERNALHFLCKYESYILYEYMDEELADDYIDEDELIETIEFLIKNGADINQSDNNYMYPLDTRNLKIFELLINKPAINLNVEVQRKINDSENDVKTTYYEYLKQSTDELDIKKLEMIDKKFTRLIYIN